MAVPCTATDCERLLSFIVVEVGLNMTVVAVKFAVAVTTCAGIVNVAVGVAREPFVKVTSGVIVHSLKI